MGNFYSYSRISTKEENDKQSFNRQIKAFETFEKENGIKFLLNFKDDKSGSTFNREELSKLEKIVQSGDTIVFKEISRLTRQAEEGYKKYIELMTKGINLIFIDNPTISTDYIKQLVAVAENQNIVTKTALEGIIKLLLIVELDRVEKEREIIVKRITDGIRASEKTQGRKEGQLDKMSEDLKKDIEDYLQNRRIKAVDIMKKHSISRNTFKKYTEKLKGS